MKRIFLPDINFWIALAFQSQSHHAIAKEWIESVGTNSCSFCRITQMGFLRLATNAEVLKQDTLNMQQAWKAYDELLSDEHIVFVDEPEGFEQAWRSYSRRLSWSTNVWTDAYLAAFAKKFDFEIVTFDQGFSQFQGLKQTILK